MVGPCYGGPLDQSQMKIKIYRLASQKQRTKLLLSGSILVTITCAKDVMLSTALVCSFACSFLRSFASRTMQKLLDHIFTKFSSTLAEEI